jgi:membrane protein implicated in regulation of membrane protease activity
MLSKLPVEKGAFFTPERLVRSWQGRAALLGVVLTALWPWACQIVVFSTVVVLALLREGLRRVRSWRAAVATVRFSQVEGVATHE